MDETARKNELKKNLRQNLYYPILLTRIPLETDGLRRWEQFRLYDATIIEVI